MWLDKLDSLSNLIVMEKKIVILLLSQILAQKWYHHVLHMECYQLILSPRCQHYFLTMFHYLSMLFILDCASTAGNANCVETGAIKGFYRL